MSRRTRARRHLVREVRVRQDGGLRTLDIVGKRRRAIARALKAAIRDPQVAAIIIAIDTPGGTF